MFNKQNVLAAIEKYGDKFEDMSVNALHAEFGNDAFPVDVLNHLWDVLSLSRMTLHGQNKFGCQWDIRLSPIIFNVQKNSYFNYAKEGSKERQYVLFLLGVLLEHPATRELVRDEMVDVLGG